MMTAESQKPEEKQTVEPTPQATEPEPEGAKAEAVLLISEMGHAPIGQVRGLSLDFKRAKNPLDSAGG